MSSQLADFTVWASNEEKRVLEQTKNFVVSERMNFMDCDSSNTSLDDKQFASMIDAIGNGIN